jgi:pteridine reductase
LQISQKTALITGAGRRIGHAVAKALHDKGFDIALHYLSSAKEIRHECDRMNEVRPDSAKIFQADLVDKDALKALSQHVLAWRPNLGVLINNAACFKPDDDVIGDSLFHTNVRAPYLLSHLMQTALSEQKGCIINLADVHGEIPLKGYDLYCMSKAALLMQTKSLARTFAPDIRVNSILTGPILWPEGESTLSEREKKEVLASTLLNQLGGTDAIIKAVLYLIDNDFVTGSKCVVDGGVSC